MSLPSYACCITRPSYSNNIQNKFKILKSSPHAVLSASYHFLLHTSKFSPKIVARNHPQIILYSQCYRLWTIKHVQLHFFRILSYRRQEKNMVITYKLLVLCFVKKYILHVTFLRSTNRTIFRSVAPCAGCVLEDESLR